VIRKNQDAPSIWTSADRIEEVIEKVNAAVEHERLKARVEQQSEKQWDTRSIAGWFARLAEDGIAGKVLDPKGLVAGKQGVLERIRQRAEECTFLSHV
jgi:hypothetical protein